MSKRIVYVGLERGDFIYYLASVLSVTAKILVADNSVTGDLFKAVNKSDDTVYEYRNITYVRNLDIAASDMDNAENSYDYILIYAGQDVEDVYFESSDLHVLAMPDCTKASIDTVAAIPYDLSSDETIIIMRDYCNKKISEKSLSVMLNVNAGKIAGKMMLSLQDIASYIALTHNGKQNVKGISDDMRAALTYVVAQIQGLNEKQAAKAVAAAKKLK